MIINQNEKIDQIEKQLIKYQNTINDQARVISIYDDNNEELRNLKKNLTEELNRAIDSVNKNSIDNDFLNILSKMQKKVEILEDRTFYTDSLYFEIVNDLVMIENKISSLILSYKEMSELSNTKPKKVIPKITNEEFTAKYIESLSQYQNGEWNTSLDGFKFLIHADSNNELADNCQYWVGEVYYALADYRRSINEFEKVFNFPGTNKADDAQFKLGLCYINIGQNNKAKQELENLIEFYPDSEYIDRSRDYLKQF